MGCRRLVGVSLPGRLGSPFVIECNDRFVLHREDDATSQAGLRAFVRALRPEADDVAIVRRVIGCRSIPSRNKGDKRL
jgi:hypothetical protein